MKISKILLHLETIISDDFVFITNISGMFNFLIYSWNIVDTPFLFECYNNIPNKNYGPANIISRNHN